MTPKEKADQLFRSHLNYLCVSDGTAEAKAKQSAIITVNEVLSVLDKYYIFAVNYWNEVKEEIEKL